jgi:AcrR family transcriptional regulator
MPKETFLNLPEDKRRRITNVALDEFALHDYRGASLSRIVETAGIAKGSMYQYFDDKKDLYLYLVGLAAETKFGFINEAITDFKGDFFKRYRYIIFHGARFDFSQARYGSILYHATYESSESGMNEVAARLKESSLLYIRDLVDEGLRQGELRQDMDAGFLSYALYQVTVALRDYLSARFGFSFRDAVHNATGSPIPEQELLAVLDEMMNLFRRGIAGGNDQTKPGYEKL